MSIAISSAVRPSRQMTTLVVPPPMSTFITAPRDSSTAPTAPEPCAAIVASRLSPALTATKRPPRRRTARRSTRALSRSSATPVRISAPVSTPVAREPGGVVLRVDERAERGAVDGRGVPVRREQDVRLVQHVTLTVTYAAVLPLELQSRKQQVGSRRPDVDADDDFFFPAAPFVQLHCLRATLNHEWDSVAIRAHAERFSLDTFRHGIAKAADELMAAPPDQSW